MADYPRLDGATLKDFFKFKVEFDRRAIARRQERKNNNDDTIYPLWALEEMIIAAFLTIQAQEERIKALEEVTRVE